MARVASIDGHIKSAREHAGREEYTAALVYFDGALEAIDRCPSATMPLLPSLHSIYPAVY